MTKRILVAGGTGFIGSYVVNKLVKQGFEVLVLGRDFNRSEIIHKLIKGKKIYPLNCDLTKPRDIFRIKNKAKSADKLVYLAQKPFISEGIATDIANVCRTQVVSTFNLLESVSSNLKGICFISSFMVYPPSNTLKISEFCLPGPEDLYGATKLLLEHYLRIYSKQKSIPLTILRLSSVYGPGDTRKGAITNFIKSILNKKPLVINGDGRAFRDYIYVEDAADAIILAVKQNRSEIYNVGTGKKTNILMLVKKLRNIAKCNEFVVKFKLKDSESLNFVLDISKIKKELKFCPKVDIDQGLKKTFMWHKEKLFLK